MKTWLGYILSAYILFCAMVPCSFIDDCEADHKIEQSPVPVKKDDCNNCPPFSICASCHSVALHPVATTVESFNCTPKTFYADYDVDPSSAVLASPFLPPRLG